MALTEEYYPHPWDTTEELERKVELNRNAAWAGIIQDSVIEVPDNDTNDFLANFGVATDYLENNSGQENQQPDHLDPNDDSNYSHAD